MADKPDESSFCQNSNCLSDYDKAVLNRIFNPSLPYVDIAEVEDENGPSTETTTSGVETTDAMRRIRKLELEAVKAAEGGNPWQAIKLLNETIQLDELRASSYNNRAQAFRLLNDVTAAEADLSKAIYLSGGKGKVAAQAFTQRALLRKLQGNDDLALEDFNRAASLGNEFSKAQVVSMNPYAALCNAMMVEMIGKIRRGETDP